MAILSTNMPAAEVFIGGTFAETFVDEYAVGLNGGTLFNNPTVSDGLVLDGVNQYASYTLDTNVLNSDPLSFVVEFIPDFNYDEDQAFYFFDAGSGGSNRYLITKVANIGSNALWLYFNGTLIAQIPSATYSPYWLVDQRNVLVISGESGDTDAYLNGNQILTADSTAWTPSNELDFFIGAAYNGNDSFEGTITSLKIYHATLSAQEALDFYNDDTYDYDDHLVMDLPCTSCFGDTGNTRTRDASDNDNDGTFGDGVTPSTYPTKREYRGYDFDGVAQYLDCGDGFNTLDAVSVAFGFSCVDVTAQQWFLNKYLNASDAWGIRTNASNLMILDDIDNAGAQLYLTAISNDTIYNVVASMAATTHENKLSVDGVLEGSGTNSTDNWASYLGNLYIGTRSPGVSPQEGSIFYCEVYSIELTEIQKADIHINQTAAHGNF